MSPLALSPELAWALGGMMILYVGVMYGIAFIAQGRIRSTEDYLVAGRSLPMSLAWATIMGTWFGAGTILAVTDEVRAEGVRRAALDPWGAGLCLILAGLVFARPLWEMGLLTISDFFRRKFGPTAELVSALIMVPSYFGWIAAQFVALAGLLQLFFGIDLAIGIVLVALVAMGYTFMGGMWSVTLTDAIQISMVLVGLLILGFQTLASLGSGNVWLGLERLAAETPPAILQPVPTETARAVLDWLAVLTVGMLGNIPGQDLMQRVFSARSAGVARRSCLLAGIAYIGFGAVPILLGLAARLLVPTEVDQAVIPALAHMFLRPVTLVVFTLSLMSAVLSTLDSAILSPASVLSQNVLERVNRGRVPALTLNRWAVVLVSLASLGIAFLGESAYTLLEGAYELTLVGLFVPLTLGLFGTPRGEAPAVASMGVGFGLWLLHYAAGWEAFLEPWTGPAGIPLPVSLTTTLCGLLAYVSANALVKEKEWAYRE